ncbi:hypothetical protein F4775DRAFT_533758 [Biscogniauxia sp. FL1348]|nr:hypothetical protein F4775DRAFT_533758 [Biscogniauxia sp. FL1348]
MTTAVSKCRGFTRPVMFLARSTPGHAVPNRPQWLRSAPARLDGSLFTTAAVLCKRPSIPASAKEKPSPPSTAVLAQKARPSTANFLEQLAQKSSPTILYEAAPQRGFVFSSYTAALFCMSVGGLNHWINVYNVPAGIPWWVPYGFGVVSFCMAIPATVFALRPAAVVRSVKVLPARSTQGSSAASKAHSAAQPIQLEIMARSHIPVPGLPLKRIVVEPRQVVMKARMYNPKLSEHEIEQAKKEEEERRKAERQYDMDHLMTAPFRHAKWAISTIFHSLRRGLTGEGFAPIWIQGTRYKIPISDAYVMDNGRALDRIVRIEESESVVRQSTEPSSR